MIHTNNPQIDDLINKQIARKTIRINCYTCLRGHLLLSHDKDDGVTPMFEACSCGGRARSNFYTPNAPDVLQAILDGANHKEMNSLDHVVPAIIWFNPENNKELELAVENAIWSTPDIAHMKKHLISATKEHWKNGGLVALYTNRYMVYKKID